MSTKTERIDGYNYFSSIPALKAAAKNAGSHFFDKGAMQFFNSRIESGMLQGRYFVTSEQFDDESPRLYSARYVFRNDDYTPSLQIETLGDFQGFMSVAQAKVAIYEHFKAGE